MSPGSDRRFAWAGRLLAVLLGLMLGLSMIAAASRIGGGLVIEGAALRDCIGGDQAWNHDTPGQPPPRLHDGQLRKDNDESDSRATMASVAREQLEPSAGGRGRLVFFERRSEASLRAREGQGARGPPSV